MVIRKVTCCFSPVGWWIIRSVACVIIDIVVPSNNPRTIGGIQYDGKFSFLTNHRSMKQSVEPQSISVLKGVSGVRFDVRGTVREFGSERADALSLATCMAQLGTTQPSGCAEYRGLHANFLAVLCQSTLVQLLVPWCA